MEKDSLFSAWAFSAVSAAATGVVVVVVAPEVSSWASSAALSSSISSAKRRTCELLGDEWRGQSWEPKDDVRGGA